MANPVDVSVSTKLQMAALILAVRTARFEGKDFAGMATPRFSCALADSLYMADRLCERARDRHPEWFLDT